MSLSTSRYQLANAMKTLQAQWNVAGEKWRDTVRTEFAEKHYEPLVARMQGVLAAMDRLDNVLAQARRDCGDE